MGQAAVQLAVQAEVVERLGVQRLAEEAERVAFLPVARCPSEQCKILPVPLGARKQLVGESWCEAPNCSAQRQWTLGRPWGTVPPAAVSAALTEQVVKLSESSGLNSHLLLL